MKSIECTKYVSLGISKLDEISKDFMDNTTSAIILLNSYNDIAFFVYPSTYLILYHAAQSNSFWFSSVFENFCIATSRHH
jgi:hypothetical protein